MNEKYNPQDFSFTSPAIYRIVIQGEIDQQISENLWGLQVEISRQQGHKPISSLVGQVRDQAALAGILNMLYNMRVTVISVNMLAEINDQ